MLVNQSNRLVMLVNSLATLDCIEETMVNNVANIDSAYKINEIEMIKYTFAEK